MQSPSLEHPNFAQTAFVSLVSFVAVALLGLVLAYWTWAWLAPHPEVRVQAAEQAISGGVVAYALFGNSPVSHGGLIPASTAVSLLGVVAAAGNQSSYALLRLDAKQSVTVREGGEVEPGVRLVEVHADHVVLERGGARETIAWKVPAASR